MKLNKNLLFILSASLLIMTQTAHADFRKALEAYQARDGATMLKEVKDAVEKKDDDGLVLFLNVLQLDEYTSKQAKLNLDVKMEHINQKSVFEEMLNLEQQKQVKSLLEKAAKNGSADAQYREHSSLDKAFKDYINLDQKLNLSLICSKKYRKSLEEIALRGSSAAVDEIYLSLLSLRSLKGASNDPACGSPEEVEKWRLKSAELGNPFSAFSLGMKYLHINADYGCDDETLIDNICKNKKDETKGLYWLKQAAKNYEKRNVIDFVTNYETGNMSFFAYEMGKLMRSRANGDTTVLRQAYLWFLLALNSPTKYHDGYYLRQIEEMKNRGELKKAAPKLDMVWNDERKRNFLLHPKILTELPDWINEIREETANQRPVFLFTFSQSNYLQYELDVYANGIVNFGVPLSISPGRVGNNRDVLIKTTPEKIKRFLQDLHDIGFEDMALNNKSYGGELTCMSHWGDCPTRDFMIVVNHPKNIKVVYMSEAIGVKHVDKNKSKNMANVFSLLEEYFPTQELRCNLGSSKGYQQQCLQQDHQLMNLAKEEN